MGQIGTKLRSASWATGKKLMHWCPACNYAHGFIVESLASPNWTFNSNYETPTFMPSMRVYITQRDGTEKTLCHYFLQDGELRYRTDSPHALTGKSVPLPDWP